ncbi:5-formyltetrahydrofolate cyclo-ligase [Shigella boydii]
MAHTVAVFLSFDGELDTQPLIEQLWRAGRRVYLPVFIPLVPLIAAPELPSAKRTGDEQVQIHEPNLDVRTCYPFPIRRADHTAGRLDEYGQRLGMGGGFYDRTLQNWQDDKRNRGGYAHDRQLVEKSPLKSGISLFLRWLHRRKSGSGKAIHLHRAH